MLFQNDIPIDVVCHRYTLNMQDSSGTKNNSSPNESFCTTGTVSFNGVLLVVNRRRQCLAVSGTHLTGLRAYRPMCPKRLYSVCLETVVPVAEESWKDRSDAVLRLFLLAVTAKYRSSFGVVTRGRHVL
ncbi:uncharacterized protein TNCV_4844011 [Trichonephila clavipes]|uniref:Uncharacterized protein n=1 Tax=Trichonephila clavipes TaxID=2585209 RepID=A0A8X6WKM0_TRICX|nr:uncharacterized protein TNCV_4844011 [Trichonephila clavipes]